MIANSKSAEFVGEFVNPATSPPPSKTYQTSPIESPNNASKDDKELRVLTNMVQALASKLKKRDREVQQLQEKADKFNEVTLELESAEERLVDTVAENQALSRRVKNLEATINLQDVEEGDRWNTVAKAPIEPAKHIDEAAFRQLRLVRATFSSTCMFISCG
jgi:septal ring factor EnvC (AmiA/AmiB activator)